MWNKDALLEYAGLFDAVMAAVRRKRAPGTAAEHDQLVGFGVFTAMTYREMYESVEKEPRMYRKWLRQQSVRRPDTSRLVEDIFILLCQLKPQQPNTVGFLRSRWNSGAHGIRPGPSHRVQESSARSQDDPPAVAVQQQTLSQWLSLFIHTGQSPEAPTTSLINPLFTLQAPGRKRRPSLPARAIEEEDPKERSPRSGWTPSNNTGHNKMPVNM
ncbi:hypothetical protein KUCAC02_029804 [Chaenocephalus aceratus]|nr:hypothetical protein KUCAC02_029804 [Chaenocephalus aceratus]